MKCRFNDNELALYVEGDIPNTRILEIENHLQSCGRCNAVAEELRESQAALKSLKQDAVSAAALAHVRTRVLAEIAGRAKPVWGRWVYAVIGFAIAAGVSVGLLARLQKPNRFGPPPIAAAVQPQTVRAPQRAGDSQPSPIRSVRAAKRNHASRRAQKAAQPDAPAAPAKQVVVQLQTDDPTVVIYWLIDEKTGGSL